MLADKLSYHEAALMINGKQSLLMFICLKQLVDYIGTGLARLDLLHIVSAKLGDLSIV